MHKLIPTPVHQFLRKMPRPAFILADDKKIPVPTGGRVWPSIWATIAVVNPKTLQAIDAQGQVIRAISIDGQPDDSDDEDEGSSETVEEQWLKAFAKHLADAYDRGSKAAAPLMAEAMRFVTQQGEMLREEKKESERLRLENAKLRKEILELTALPQQEGGEMGGIWGSILQGALMSPQGQALLTNMAGGGHPPKMINGAKTPRKES